jgi:hypothetical protein
MICQNLAATSIARLSFCLFKKSLVNPPSQDLPFFTLFNCGLRRQAHTLNNRLPWSAGISCCRTDDAFKVSFLLFLLFVRQGMPDGRKQTFRPQTVCDFSGGWTVRAGCCGQLINVTVQIWQPWPLSTAVSLLRFGWHWITWENV